MFVCLSVCWGLFCVVAWGVCKEGDEEKVRARTWVGAQSARRAETQRGVW